MTIYGLDVSNHQGNLTGFGGVAASFLCHKLTEGTTYTDPYASHNLAFARRHHLPVLGGYHYVRAGDGAGQADYFVARARALFGHELRGHLWQLDCESDASWADVKAFKHRWDAATGGAPILFYSGDWWLSPRGWNVASLGFAGLWAAPNRGYVGKANNVRSGDWVAGYGGYDKLTILQYDARASIGDTNQYTGTITQLRDLCRGSTPNPRRKVHMYTSVNAHGVTLVKGEKKKIQFTSAGAAGAWKKPYGDHGELGGYNVGVSHADHVGSISISGNTSGARIRVRFIEIVTGGVLHKNWPASIVADEVGVHTVNHWNDQGSRLYVELEALDSDTTVDVACVTTALT